MAGLLTDLGGLIASFGLNQLGGHLDRKRQQEQLEQLAQDLNAQNQNRVQFLSAQNPDLAGLFSTISAQPFTPEMFRNPNIGLQNSSQNMNFLTNPRDFTQQQTSNLNANKFDVGGFLAKQSGQDLLGQSSFGQGGAANVPIPSNINAGIGDANLTRKRPEIDVRQQNALSQIGARTAAEKELINLRETNLRNKPTKPADADLSDDTAFKILSAQNAQFDPVSGKHIDARPEETARNFLRIKELERSGMSKVEAIGQLFKEKGLADEEALSIIEGFGVPDTGGSPFGVGILSADDLINNTSTEQSQTQTQSPVAGVVNAITNNRQQQRGAQQPNLLDQQERQTLSEPLSLAKIAKQRDAKPGQVRTAIRKKYPELTRQQINQIMQDAGY